MLIKFVVSLSLLYAVMGASLMNVSRVNSIVTNHSLHENSTMKAQFVPMVLKSANSSKVNVSVAANHTKESVPTNPANPLKSRDVEVTLKNLNTSDANSTEAKKLSSSSKVFPARDIKDVKGVNATGDLRKELNATVKVSSTGNSSNSNSSSSRHVRALNETITNNSTVPANRSMLVERALTETINSTSNSTSNSTAQDAKKVVRNAADNSTTLNSTAHSNQSSKAVLDSANVTAKAVNASKLNPADAKRVVRAADNSTTTNSTVQNKQALVERAVIESSNTSVKDAGNSTTQNSTAKVVRETANDIKSNATIKGLNVTNSEANSNKTVRSVNLKMNNASSANATSSRNATTGTKIDTAKVELSDLVKLNVSSSLLDKGNATIRVLRQSPINDETSTADETVTADEKDGVDNGDVADSGDAANDETTVDEE